MWLNKRDLPLETVALKVVDQSTAQKMKFSFTDFPEDLVTFFKEIRNGKLHFLCSEA